MSIEQRALMAVAWVSLMAVPFAAFPAYALSSSIVVYVTITVPALALGFGAALLSGMCPPRRHYY